MTDESAWEEAVKKFHVGSQVKGTVKVHMPFGFFVTLNDAPQVSAIVDIISYRPGGDSLGPEHWPSVGEEVEATVADLRADSRQVRLRIGPPLVENRETQGKDEC